MSTNDNIKKSILSVDDEPTNRLIIERLLQNDYNVISAENGETALKLIETNQIDLILLDIMMPDVDGLAVCSKIRSNERFKEIPIIFLTAKYDAEDVKDALEKGGNDYLVKPFRSVELKARIETQLKLSESKYLKIQSENLKTLKNLMVRLNHELRNSLAIISVAIGTLKTDDPCDHNKVAQINKAIEHISDVLSRIEKIEEIKLTSYTQSSTMLDIDS